MELKQNDYVVYNGTEICRIGERVKKSFDGENEKEYYMLFPNDSKNKYYVPVEKIKDLLRPVLTREQLIALIDNFPNTKSEWISNKNERKYNFSAAIKSGDYSRIIPLMNGYYNEKHNTQSNKKLFNDDKRNFELALKLLHTEVAFVFGIDFNDVEKFIRNRVNYR